MKLFVYSLFAAVAFVSMAIPSTTEVPGGAETLVLLDTMDTKDSYSQFFDMLKAKGYSLTFKQSDDASLGLKKYGEYLYKHLILFSPTTEEFGGSINTQALTEFVDDGGNILAAVNSKVGDAMKELAAECGFEVDVEGAQLIDHMHYDTKLDNGDHTTVVVEAKQLVEVDAMVGVNHKKYNPILFKGIGIYTDRKNPLVTNIVRGSSSAYSYSTSAKITTKPMSAGTSTALLASLQARNNARVLFSGSLLMFSNDFLKASVQSASGATSAKSGNRDLVEALSRWVFKETGVLRYSNVKHGGPYTVTDPATFSMKVEMLDDSGKWVAYDHPTIQMEFVRIDPFVRTDMKRKSGDGTYEVTFKVPDVYGVYQFKVDHRRAGFDHLVVSSQVSVHPLQHTMYERFIPAARPYYWSALSMMLGVFVFSFVFMHNKDEQKTKKD